MSALFFLNEDERLILERTYFEKRNSISKRIEAGIIHPRQFTQRYHNGDGGIDHCVFSLLSSSKIRHTEKLSILHDYVAREYPRCERHGDHYVWKNEWVHVRP